MTSAAREALARLQDGNARFVAGTPRAVPLGDRRRELVAGQHPFAIVVGCSDSRVPVEAVFDQSLGDLFVVRVAGNVVASTQAASVEFAAETFGSRLVVVLGHTRCGAIRAVVEHVRSPGEPASGNLESVVECIRPAVLRARNDAGDQDAWERLATRENVIESVRRLREGSDVLARLVRRERLEIVGAEYSVETGVVQFLDPPRDA